MWAKRDCLFISWPASSAARRTRSERSATYGAIDLRTSAVAVSSVLSATSALLPGPFFAICLITVFLLASPTGAQAQSTTTYKYDALGRLREEVRPNGATQYVYDKAGNRKSVASPSTTGTFSFVSGVHVALGAPYDRAIATVRNTGAATITGITVSCVNQWGLDSPQPTSIAPGATATFTCRAFAAGLGATSLSLTSSSASNSPFWTPSF
jgi:hypothetical protein